MPSVAQVGACCWFSRFSRLGLCRCAASGLSDLFVHRSVSLREVKFALEPLHFFPFVLILFGAYENGSGPATLVALPEIAWEASLGIYAAWKGFRPSPIVESKVAMA
jgi:hypothetical protein